MAPFKRFSGLIILSFFVLLTSCRSAGNTGVVSEAGIAGVKTASIGPGPQFGFCHAGYSRTEAEYELLNDLGATWIRIDISWKDIEPTPGEWDFTLYDEIILGAVDHDIKVLAVLGFDTPWTREHVGDDKRRIHPDSLPAFLNYVHTVARRYGSLVGAFEVWNEPNLPRFWGGTDSEFFEMTRRTLFVLDETSPDTPVGVGSIHISPFFHGKRFLRDFLDAGCMEGADALTIHPYAADTDRAARWVAHAGNEMENRGISAELWVTEVGFPTESAFPYNVTLEEQPEFVRKSLTGLVDAGVNLITWYKLFSNKEWEKKAGPFDGASFGLIWKKDKDDFDWKPGAIEYMNTIKMLSENARN